MTDPAKLTRKEIRTLWWGKLRRYLLHSFRPGYIASRHSMREGECLRCGACCRMGPQCHYYDSDENGLGLCKRHEIRPRNCRVFPIDEKDLSERDIVAKGTACGFHFNGNGRGASSDPDGHDGPDEPKAS